MESSSAQVWKPRTPLKCNLHGTFWYHKIQSAGGRFSDQIQLGSSGSCTMCVCSNIDSSFASQRRPRAIAIVCVVLRIYWPTLANSSKGSFSCWGFCLIVYGSFWRVLSAQVGKFNHAYEKAMSLKESNRGLEMRKRKDGNFVIMFLLQKYLRKY